MIGHGSMSPYGLMWWLTPVAIGQSACPSSSQYASTMAMGSLARIRTMKRRTRSTSSGVSAISSVGLGPMTR